MRKLRRSQAQATINIVPLVDVLLVLLVLLMAFVSFVREGVEIDLPEAKAKPLALEEVSLHLVVNINAKGSISAGISALPPMAFTLPSLKEYLRNIAKNYGSMQVFVRGDASTNYQSVVSVLEALNQVGLDKVSLVTDKEEQ